MKENAMNFGGGLQPYLRPELITSEIVVEKGFAASEEFPAGTAKPLDAWGNRMFDAFGEPIEE